MSDPEEPIHIKTAPSADLTVSLYEEIKRRDLEGDNAVNAPMITLASGTQIAGRVLATMMVSRQALIGNSSQFKALLRGKFEEANQNVIDIQEGTIKSLELWFRVLHNKMTDEMYTLPTKEVWEAIEVCGYRDFDINKLKPWFFKWMERKEIKKLEHNEMRELLYPCQEFVHAKGFALLTKTLAYKMADHITERNPTRHYMHHLDPNVIGSVNGARGSLRSKLLRGLFSPVGLFLTQRCDCKEKSLFAYCVGLSKTGIWPIEDHHKKSVYDVLTSPGFTKFNCKIPEGACLTCRSKINPDAVESTRLKLLRDFDGLCLDCMNMTKSEDVDGEYWEHDISKEWDAGCSIKHGQPTWYFSFVGRKTEMKAHHLRKKRHWENHGFPY